MQKPDKVLRYRPLKEVKGALAKLQRVVLFHATPIVEKLDSQYLLQEGRAAEGQEVQANGAVC
jgi:hypothetical protein